jgi:hypothetical protein
VRICPAGWIAWLCRSGASTRWNAQATGSAGMISWQCTTSVTGVKLHDLYPDRNTH